MWSADISRFLSVFFGSKLHELALGFDIGEGDGHAIEDSQNTGLDEHGSASPFSLIVAEKAQKCQAKSAYSFAVSSFLG
jgi:hypothetical protein